MILEAIQKAKTNKKDLDVIWLDLAYAYGLVPHKMILLSLQMYHIPDYLKNNIEQRSTTRHCSFVKGEP